MLVKGTCCAGGGTMRPSSMTQSERLRRCGAGLRAINGVRMQCMHFHTGGAAPVGRWRDRDALHLCEPADQAIVTPGWKPTTCSKTAPARQDPKTDSRTVEIQKVLRCTTLNVSENCQDKFAQRRTMPGRYFPISKPSSAQTVRQTKHTDCAILIAEFLVI